MFLPQADDMLKPDRTLKIISLAVKSAVMFNLKMYFAHVFRRH